MLIAGLRRTEPTSLEQLTQYISLHTSVKPRSTSLLPCPLSQESQLTYLQTYLSTYPTRHISFYTMSTLDALNISGVPTYLIPSLLTQLLAYNVLTCLFTLLAVLCMCKRLTGFYDMNFRVAKCHEYIRVKIFPILMMTKLLLMIR